MESQNFYESVAPPYRIQKRLVLNQCYKAISKELESQPRRLTYVTLGGADLYDVLDLLCVFDVRRSELSVISYEADMDVAARARECVVARALKKVETFDLEVVPRLIGADSLEPIEAKRKSEPCITFLDFLNPFSEANQDVVFSLLRSGCLRPKDFLLVTSSLTERVLHQPTFMDSYSIAFQQYFKIKEAEITRDFKIRNHVDLLVAQASIKAANDIGGKIFTTVELLSKFRYRDTRTPMGVWLFRINQSGALPTKLHDLPLEDYPWSAEPSEDAARGEATYKIGQLMRRLASRKAKESADET